MANFSNPSVPLTAEAARAADASGAPPVINNHALFQRVQSLESAATALDTSVEELQATDGVEYVEVIPTQSPRKFLYLGENRRVTKIEVKRLTAVSGGAGLAQAIAQDSGLNTLLSGSSADATTFTADWTTLNLSVTAGRLNIEDGIVRVGLNTVDAGASGGPVWFRVTHIAIPS